MNVVSTQKLRQFREDHPDARDAGEPLDAWFRLARKSKWTKFADLKAICKSADMVGKYTVINVGGNKYRLILEVFYESSLILIRHVLTHAEYDKGNWKADVYK